MHRIAAAILALSVTQQDAPPAAAPAPEVTAPQPADPPPTEAAPAARAPGPSQHEPAPPPPSPRPPPAPPAIAPSPPTPAAAASEPAPRPAAPAPPKPAQVPAPPPVAPPPPAPPPARLPAAARPQPAAPVSTSRPAADPAPRTPASEREQLVSAALAFLDALIQGDASGLAEASSSRFSFDGDVVVGTDAQARRWRELLAERGQVAQQTLRDLVVMTGDEAVAQMGPPPARLAQLVTAGAWVAVADVSERPVILFLVREGDRFAVAGMHD